MKKPAAWVAKLKAKGKAKAKAQEGKAFHRGGSPGCLGKGADKYMGKKNTNMKMPSKHESQVKDDNETAQMLEEGEEEEVLDEDEEVEPKKGALTLTMNSSGHARAVTCLKGSSRWP